MIFLIYILAFNILYWECSVLGISKADTEYKDELESKISYIHSSLGKSCDYEKYKEKMEPFWDEFFSSRQYPRLHEDIVFNLKFADIYVDFETDEVKKTFQMYEDPKDPNNPVIINVTVDINTQRQEEQSRCFTGGLITCDETLKICVCMNDTWTSTVLVDENTGIPLENQIPVPNTPNQACFVEKGYPCLLSNYLYGTINFNCIEHFRCSTTTGDCYTHEEVEDAHNHI